LNDLIGGSTLVPRPAQYLLRFDDLCPTISRGRWQQFLPLIEEFGLRPILAVVPDNQDFDLQRAEPDPGFWAQMRAMEAAGATIALHGYRHLCRSNGKSMVPLHHHSEFAGVPADTQRQWILAGLHILRGHGLNPKIWVAPRHGFDRHTLAALRDEGIGLVSDGLARIPFLREGLTWIPQQLWGPVEKSKGVWTICVHPNAMSGGQVDQLRNFLGKHWEQFTSVERVVAKTNPQKLNQVERVYELLAEWRVRVSKARKRMRVQAGK
jgi:predicted deacetylase